MAPSEPLGYEEGAGARMWAVKSYDDDWLGFCTDSAIMKPSDLCWVGREKRILFSRREDAVALLKHIPSFAKKVLVRVRG